MKKTISIQISGMLFHVDDDAYAKLDEYLSSIRAHFAHLPDSEEVIGDIENRIAETFSETLKKNKQTITMRDVDALIATMGTVKDFEAFEDASDGAETPRSEAETKREGVRRFYRNPDDKVIAGVASGIASYFNIDPVIIRVIFVVLAFMHGIGLLAYIILWIAMPLAKTQSQRLEMRGEPMTISHLDAKIQGSTLKVDVSEPFTSIYTRGGVRLKIRHGKECTVSARGTARALEQLDIRVVDGQLHIDRLQGSWMGWMFHGFRHLWFDITLPELSGIDVAGACNVDIDGCKGKDMTLKVVGASSLRAKVTATALHVHAEGASTARIAGTGETIDITSIGASHVDAAQFLAKRGHADISGASNASAQVEETIDGHANGASHLRVYGNPTVSVRTTGASSVHANNKNEETQKEWHWKDEKYDHKKYTNEREPRGVVGGFAHVILVIAQTIIRFIGGLMTAVGTIALIFLVIGLIQFFRDGAIPYLHIGMLPMHSWVGWIAMADAFFLVLVPIILLLTFGASLIHLRRQFDTTGIVTLIAFWMVALVVTAAVGSKLLRTMRASHGDTVTQQITVGSFSGVVIDSPDDVQITRGTQTAVSVTGDAEEVQNLAFTVTDQTLHIGSTSDSCFFCHGASITITVPRLTMLHTIGLSQAVLSDMQGNISLEANDMSRIRISGSGQTLQMITHDLGRIDANQYTATTAIVTVADLSRVLLSATDVSGSVSGLGRVDTWNTKTMHVSAHDLSSIEQHD